MEEEGERIALKVRYDTKNIETYMVKPEIRSGVDESNSQASKENADYVM